MNARGATVPLSAGFRLIWTQSDRRAESKVGGAVGIGTGAAPFVFVFVLVPMLAPVA